MATSRKDDALSFSASVKRCCSTGGSLRTSGGREASLLGTRKLLAPGLTTSNKKLRASLLEDVF